MSCKDRGKCPKPKRGDALAAAATSNISGIDLFHMSKAQSDIKTQTETIFDANDAKLIS